MSQDQVRNQQRMAFALFLERLAEYREEPFDWYHHIVNHYPDDELEMIRIDVVRLTYECGRQRGNSWSLEDRMQLQQWANQLRLTPRQ